MVYEVAFMLSQSAVPPHNNGMSRSQVSMLSLNGPKKKSSKHSVTIKAGSSFKELYDRQQCASPLHGNYKALVSGE